MVFGGIVRPLLLRHCDPKCVPGANTTLFFMNLAPVFTAIIAIFALGEELKKLPFNRWWCGITGVMLARKHRTPLTELFRREKGGSRRFLPVNRIKKQ